MAYQHKPAHPKLRAHAVPCVVDHMSGARCCPFPMQCNDPL